MAADKNLFMYDFAIVAIMKNEGHYAKEWLDYHLAAGVDHFYIYDNESTDNLKEVLQPYIEAGTVTYTFYPGIGKQIRAYNDAFKNYRFFCRYMAFIDADEFIFPQSKKSIVTVADEIFNEKEDLGGIEVNWQIYGSNFQETADYSKGVLERFTRRAEEISSGVKSIANPRKISYIDSVHYLEYFHGTPEILAETDEGKALVASQILINHYQFKSHEEFSNKMSRGSATYYKPDFYTEDDFNHIENNEVFDDSILKYRDARALKKVGKAIGKEIDYDKLIGALFQNLNPIISGENLEQDFFEGKLETFLTCRALASYLKENILDETRGAFIEKATLKAIQATALTNLSVADAELLLNELPNILKLNYPEVKEILNISLAILERMKDEFNAQIDSFGKLKFWKDFNELDNLSRILESFKCYYDKQE